MVDRRIKLAKFPPPSPLSTRCWSGNWGVAGLSFTGKISSHWVTPAPKDSGLLLLLCCRGKRLFDARFQGRFRILAADLQLFWHHGSRRRFSLYRKSY